MANDHFFRNSDLAPKKRRPHWAEWEKAILFTCGWLEYGFHGIDMTRKKEKKFGRSSIVACFVGGEFNTPSTYVKI